MNKPTIKDITFDNWYAYSLRRQALAYRHASHMVRIAHPDSDLNHYFRKLMRDSSVRMVQHAKTTIAISCK